MKGPEKRRTIWVNDEDWRAISERAVRQGVSPSALIRAALINGSGVLAPDTLRDAVVSVVSRPGFGSSRPAPKPGAKK